jgi:hypothetical protein
MACSGSGVNDRFFGEVGDPVPVSPYADGQPKAVRGSPWEWAKCPPRTKINSTALLVADHAEWCA